MARQRKCEDWECPSKWSCAHAFCRSHAYWAMKQPGPELFKGDRRRHQDACAEYERDRPRPWLKDVFTSPVSGRPDIPDDYPGLQLVQ